jgi:F-type H+-transporting ATPase subunit delta
MAEETVGLRYAEALYLSATHDAVLLERVAFELENFVEVVKKYPELTLYFDSPLVEDERKYQFLSSLSQELEISDEIQGLLRSVIKRGRFLHLGAILKAFKKILDAGEGSDEVVIFSPRPLAEKEEAQVKTRLEVISGKRLAAKVKIDPKLISGIRAEIGFKIYDSSLAYRLQLLKEKMVGSN